MINTVSVIGLGLIGASIAKAVDKYTSCEVYGFNRTKAVTQKAIEDEVILAEVDDEILGKSDLVLVGLFPHASIEYMEKIFPKLKKGCIVVDLVGVKGSLISSLEQKAIGNGVVYIGGHPMAGLEVNGYDNSFADLYQNASMILVPNLSCNEKSLADTGKFFKKIGFGMIKICSAEKHDQIIAFTSQLAHVVSNAYVKNKSCEERLGFSAGSYKDLTRVAQLNENMWSELFLLNKKALVNEIDEFIANVTELRDLIENEDLENLTKSLAYGSERKKRLG